MITFKLKVLVLIGAAIGLTAGAVAGQEIVSSEQNPEKITEGYEFTEGPYWHPEGFLLFSDIPANTIYKWQPGSEDTNVFMRPSGHSNGITATLDGTLILAQHDGMVSAINSENKMEILANSYDGKRLNSPNDVTVSSDGTIYFTDPPYGIDEEARELSFSGVYVLYPDKEGEPELVFDKFDRPNGVVLSPDETKVYVNDTATGRIMVFERREDGMLANPIEFAGVGAAGDTGAADGMVVDEDGRLYTTGPGGIHVFSPDGEEVDLIEMPARTTNLDWGGEELNTLYLTTPNAVYRLETNVTGFKR